MHKKIILFLFTLISISAMAQQKIVQTAGRTQLGEFAPEFAHLNDDVLFGEVWSRNDLLPLRDRSLVTLTSLISQGITDNSLNYHLREANSSAIVDLPTRRAPLISKAVEPSLVCFHSCIWA